MTKRDPWPGVSDIVIEEKADVPIKLCNLTQQDIQDLLDLAWAKEGDTIELSNGYCLTLIDNEIRVEERRWAYINMLVVMHQATGMYYGFYYEVDATEMQDNDPWSYVTPELVLLERVPTYTYREVK